LRTTGNKNPSNFHFHIATTIQRTDCYIRKTIMKEFSGENIKNWVRFYLIGFVNARSGFKIICLTGTLNPPIKNIEVFLCYFPSGLSNRCANSPAGINNF
jgi:hypothetical protein